MKFKKEFVIVDLETTGLNVYLDKIIEISCMVFAAQKSPKEVYHRMLNPKLKINDGASAVHGIRNEDVEDKPIFEEIVKDVRNLLKGRIFVAHNARFDCSLLNSEFRKSNIDYQINFNETFDTYMFCKKNFNFKNNKLDNIAVELGAMEKDEIRRLRMVHSAKNDTYILYRTFEKIVEKKEFKKMAYFRGWASVLI